MPFRKESLLSKSRTSRSSAELPPRRQKLRQLRPAAGVDAKPGEPSLFPGDPELYVGYRTHSHDVDTLWRLGIRASVWREREAGDQSDYRSDEANGPAQIGYFCQPALYIRGNGVADIDRADRVRVAAALFGADPRVAVALSGLAAAKVDCP